MKKLSGLEIKLSVGPILNKSSVGYQRPKPIDYNCVRWRFSRSPGVISSDSRGLRSSQRSGTPKEDERMPPRNA